jgi:cation:H+ antiporter
LVTAVPLLLVAFAIILAAAEVFTNGVEWVGVRLGLGHGAVGSILAAFGTAMPETMIPLIAIIFVGSADSNEVGVGAILGAPFLLSTAAFAVAGISLLSYRGRREHAALMHFDSAAITRDLTFFFILYLGGIGSSFLPGHPGKIVVAGILLLIYAAYVYKTLTGSGESADEDELTPLRLHGLLGGQGSPHTLMAWAQVIAALALMISGAYLFVTEIDRISVVLHLPPLVLSLVIAPLATELPETFNSVLWVREGKDTLAMGNISGAMVFQSAIPVSIGAVFTDWELPSTALISAGIALASTLLVFIAIRRDGTVSGATLARAGFFWVAFVIYVVVKTIVE